jgi:hypothetical protein
VHGGEPMWVLRWEVGRKHAVPGAPPSQKLAGGARGSTAAAALNSGHGSVCYLLATSLGKK